MDWVKTCCATYLLLLLSASILFSQLSKTDSIDLRINEVELLQSKVAYPAAKTLAFDCLADSRINDLQRAQLYFLIGDIYIRNFVIDSTQFYLQKLKSSITESSLTDPVIKADALLLEGKYHRVNGSFHKAIGFFDRANVLYKQNLDKEHVKIGETYHQLGIAFSRLEKADTSYDYLQKALSIFKNNNKPKHFKIAAIYSTLANYFMRTGDMLKAIDFNQKSLDIKLQIVSKEHFSIGNSYYNLAIVYRYKGEYLYALELYKKALSIYEQNYGKDGHANIVRFYTAIGDCYSAIGDYDKAYIYSEHALQLRLNKFDDGDILLARAYLTVGGALTDIEEYSKAEPYFLKALEIFLDIDDEVDSYSVGMAYLNLGNVYSMTSQFEKGLSHYKKAESIFSNSHFQGKSASASVNFNLGVLFNNMKKYEQALKYHQIALEDRKKAFGLFEQGTIKSYSRIALTLTNLERYDEALDTFQKALSLLNYNIEKPYDFSQVSQLQLLQSTLKHRAETYEKLALKAPRKYQKELNKIRDQLLALQDFIYQNAPEQINNNYFLEVSSSIYEDGIKDLLLSDKSDKYQLAFEIAEKSKNRQISANIKKEEIKHFANISDSLLQREQELQTELNYLLNQKSKNINEQKRDSILSNYDGQIFKLKLEQEKLIAFFKHNFPEYYHLKYDQEVTTIKQIQEKIQSNETILEYFVGEENIYVFLIRKDDFYAYEIKKDFPLDSWIERFRTSIYEYWTAPNLSQQNAKISYEEFVSSASNLYQKLIEPIADKLTKKLIIIPDGRLNFIPFEALLITPPIKEQSNYADLAYMLKKYQISYNYSANLFVYLMNQKTGTNTNNLLSIAPIFKGPKQAFRSLPELRTGYGSLPFNQDEARTVAVLMDGIILSGNEATKEAFLKNASSSQIIHLATHSKANDALGDYSYMAFQSSEDSINTYSHLYARELYNLKLNADMVVLSACESGLGELKRGEGVIGLARAFAYAGAKSTVTSLWRVSDRETTELMKLFYTNLKAGQAKDEALRNAKLNYLHTSKRKAPFFWAGFIPCGNMQAIVIKNDTAPWSLYNVFLFVLLIVIIGLGFKFFKQRKN